MIQSLEAEIELTCISCGYWTIGYASLLSHKTCHIWCSQCKEEVLSIYYEFTEGTTGRVSIHQNQEFLGYHQKDFLLAPGDTLKTRFDNFTKESVIIITIQA